MGLLDEAVTRLMHLQAVTTSTGCNARTSLRPV
jgi:hypothetical protein